MIISHSRSNAELRRTAVRDSLLVVRSAPLEPDTINCVVHFEKRDVLPIVELERRADRSKTIYFWDVDGGNWEKTEVGSKGSDVVECSRDLMQLIYELEVELDEWEKRLREPLGPWDERLLADPPADFDELVNEEEQRK